VDLDRANNFIRFCRVIPYPNLYLLLDVTSWFVIKGFRKLSTFVFLIAILFEAGFIISCVVLLPVYVGFCDTFVKLVEMNEQLAKREHNRFRTRSKKICYVEAKVIRSIKIKFGPFFYKDRKHVPNQLFLMSQRICDAILIIDF